MKFTFESLLTAKSRHSSDTSKPLVNTESRRSDVIYDRNLKTNFVEKFENLKMLNFCQESFTSKVPSIPQCLYIAGSDSRRYIAPVCALVINDGGHFFVRQGGTEWWHGRRVGYVVNNLVA